MLDFFPKFVYLDRVGSEYVNILLPRIQNPFWEDVLKHYKRFCLKQAPQNISSFNSEFIFYNVNILKGGNVVFLKTWIDQGIYCVRHLLDDMGNFLSYEAFLEKYENINTNFLTFRGVIQAIKAFQTKINIQPIARYKIKENETWQIIYRGNKFIQSILNMNNNPIAGIVKWNRSYDNLNWKDIFNAAICTSIDVQLRWLQLRILHRIIATNKYLHLRKAVTTPLCTFCGRETETICHLFWECPSVVTFWLNLQKYLAQECFHCVNFHFTKRLVIFGIDENIVTDKVLNFIVLLAKQYIYKCKWKKAIPLARIFITVLKDRYTTEKYLSIMAFKLDTFLLEWLPYDNMIVRSNTLSSPPN